MQATRTKKDTAERAMAKAMSHPLRLEVWAILDNQEASPTELAELLNESIQKVAYHVNLLHKRWGYLELVRTERGRGAPMHFYRAVRRPYFSDEAWNQMPISGRQRVSGTIVGMIGEDLDESMKAGAFDSRKDRHLSRMPLVLDEEAWRELNRRLNRTLEGAFDLQAEAAARMAQSKEPGFPVRMVLIGHPMPDRKENFILPREKIDFPE